MPYAKFYTFFSVKWVFLSSLSLFEIGSLICAVANDSTTFIVGRAVQGLGSSGLYTGAATAVAAVAPLNKRALITGIIGGLFGLSSIIAPLVSDAYDEDLPECLGSPRSDRGSVGRQSLVAVVLLHQLYVNLSASHN